MNCAAVHFLKKKIQDFVVVVVVKINLEQLHCAISCYSFQNVIYLIFSVLYSIDTHLNI